MNKWFPVKDEEALKGLPNGTQIRYQKEGVCLGYETVSSTPRSLRYIHHNYGGARITSCDRKPREDDGKLTISCESFNFGDYDSVEYFKESCRDETDKRSELEKSIADMILG